MGIGPVRCGFRQTASGGVGVVGGVGWSWSDLGSLVGAAGVGPDVAPGTVPAAAVLLYHHRLYLGPPEPLYPGPGDPGESDTAAVTPASDLYLLLGVFNGRSAGSRSPEPLPESRWPRWQALTLPGTPVQTNAAAGVTRACQLAESRDGASVSAKLLIKLTYAVWG
eukprot:751508-Hanusia_phi.AAC.1